MLPGIQFSLICLQLWLQLHTAFALSTIPLTNPSLSLMKNPAASNFSKPTYPQLHIQLPARTDIPPTSSDIFPIPNIDLVLSFSVFGPILEISELNELLTRAQDDIQTLISRHGADLLTPDDEYAPWHTGDIALEVYKVTTDGRLTLGQFRSLIEGLGLYMIKGKRSREAKFRLLRKGEISLTSLAGGDIWLIGPDGGSESSVAVGDTDQPYRPAVATHLPVEN
ncbi:hypothetical protein HO173_001613 [Letharia columbiana]|uniref:Uncharacterized protein n=1 Tax=Letharia columbiana TaxID=112416 RepID=A0A8H6G427_9LECA|nr:uncharacterized protein HO173_001613 [Letharia columbiana]KAF6240005.1 hypothetical protein HO173_001613 [Letharia columbiana]